MKERTAAVDPCTENALLDNLGRRNPNYTTQPQESNLCDYHLDEGYRCLIRLLLQDVKFIVL